MTLESLGHAVSNTAGALKGNPLCLTLLLLIVVIYSLDTWRAITNIRERNDVLNTLIERCMEPAKR